MKNWRNIIKSMMCGLPSVEKCTMCQNMRTFIRAVRINKSFIENAHFVIVVGGKFHSIRFVSFLFYCCCCCCTFVVSIFEWEKKRKEKNWRKEWKSNTIQHNTQNVWPRIDIEIPVRIRPKFIEIISPLNHFDCVFWAGASASARTHTHTKQTH